MEPININQMQQMLDEMSKKITENISKNVQAALGDLKLEIESNTREIQDHNTRLDYIERDLKRRNVVFFGVEDSESNYFELEDAILDIVNNLIKVKCSTEEIDFVRRIGRRGAEARPIVVGFTTFRKKLSIMKNKHFLKDYNIYVKDDLPKKILEERKALRPEMERLQSEGKKVILKYNKIIVLENNTSELLETVETEKNDIIPKKVDEQTINAESCQINENQGLKRAATSPINQQMDRNKILLLKERTQHPFTRKSIQIPSTSKSSKYHTTRAKPVTTRNARITDTFKRLESQELVNNPTNTRSNRNYTRMTQSFYADENTYNSE